ncbi:MAG: hypothetical protein OEY59_04485 [Deltaproteobacteria bacterium]|nr:hypothetical protein [Deltaproteobacteria bacterium]
MESEFNVKDIVNQLCDRKKELEVYTKSIQSLYQLIPTLEELREINPKLLEQKEDLSRLEKQLAQYEKEYNQQQNKLENLREKIPILQVELARLKAEKKELDRIILVQKEHMPDLEAKDTEELKAQINHLKNRIKYINGSKDQKEYYFKLIEDLEKEIVS